MVTAYNLQILKTSLRIFPKKTIINWYNGSCYNNLIYKDNLIARY